MRNVCVLAFIITIINVTAGEYTKGNRSCVVGIIGRTACGREAPVRAKGLPVQHIWTDVTHNGNPESGGNNRVLRAARILTLSVRGPVSVPPLSRSANATRR